MPSADAAAADIVCASTNPRLPVHAFALPLLMITAWARPDLSFCSLMITGAALVLICVNMPAAEAGSRENTSARSTFLALIPQ